MNALAQIHAMHSTVADSAVDDADFNLLMTRPATTGSVNHLMFSDQKMDRMIRTAEIMATGKTTVPQHLRGSLGDCMAIVIQAAQWDMNPFSVAQKTHLVNGTLGYEAQLVNAVIITRAPIVSRPAFEWEGNWVGVNGKTDKSDALAVTVSATFIGNDEPTALRVSMAQAGIRNSPLWETDPRQQLAYLAIKRWARLYCPDVLLGVYSADELEPDPVGTPPPATPRADSLKERLKPEAPPLEMNPETGEIADPIAGLLQSIADAQSVTDLEKHRDEVAALKGAIKRRAVEAWNARKAELQTAAVSQTTTEQ